MSATGKTTNYGFPVYNVNDKTTWSDFNLGMTDIDTALKTVGDKADTGSTTADAALEAANNAQSTATNAMTSASSAVTAATEAKTIANNATIIAGDAITDAHASLEASNKNTVSINSINTNLTFTVINSESVPGMSAGAKNPVVHSTLMGALKGSAIYTKSGLSTAPNGEYVLGRYSKNFLKLPVFNNNSIETTAFSFGGICFLQNTTTDSPVIGATLHALWDGSKTIITGGTSDWPPSFVIICNLSYFLTGTIIDDQVSKTSEALTPFYVTEDSQKFAPGPNGFIYS